MRDIKPVIQLAKERALFRFSALALHMLQDASTSITELTSTATSAAEQKTISAAKEWLATQGTVFLKRLYTSYFGYVEHAMQTMYRDLRHELREISTDSWTLIGDDVITRQIEVERRVLRLRDADQISLGHLNLMIAQLHDEHDVRERENPFRPYLMARALHDVLCEMTSTTDLCTMLFDHMSGALAAQLPDYFNAIREVFESNGVHARLLARPSSLSKRDREMLLMPSQGLPGTSSANAYSVNSLASPALEHVLSLLQQRQIQPNSVAHVSQQQEGQAGIQDFVWKIFNQSAPGRIPTGPRHPDGASGNVQVQGAEDGSSKPNPLASQLHRLQQEVIKGDVTENDAVLFDLHSELETERLSEMERVTVDLVAMLFNFINNEALISPVFCKPIVQLQVPFLKAAMYMPAILQQADHPVRKLLNRMSSVAIGLNMETSVGKDIHAQLVSVSETILTDFKADLAVFKDAAGRFDSAVEKTLREADAETSRAINALEEAEKDPQRHDVLVVQTVNALRERLSTIETDPRVVSFIVKVWARVLVYVNEHEEIDSQPYRDVMPDLIWSVQEELDASERSTLMRLLPKLVKRVKDGLQLIRMSDAESKQVMDELVAMHAQVLRTIQTVTSKQSIELAKLHQHFASLHIGTSSDTETTTAIHAPTVPHIRLQAALQKFDVSAHLYLDSDVGTLLSSDIKWLGGMHLGTSVEWWVNDGYLQAKLMWVNQQQSFYLFKLTEPDRQPSLLIYSSISLIKALREGSIGMIEYAPIFERAIESLLNVADAQQQIPA